MIRQAAESMGYQPNRNVSRVMSEIRSRGKPAYKESLAYLTTFQPGTHAYEDLLVAGAKTRAEEIGYGLDPLVIREDGKDTRAITRTLKARGIRGLVIAPFARSGVQLDLPWDRFALTSIGSTLDVDGITRVSRDILHEWRMFLPLMREKGYERIGFVMRAGHEERMDYSNLSGYLLYQWQHRREKLLPPLVKKDLTREEFFHWVKTSKPDAIISARQPVSDWLKEARIRLPEDLGFFALNSPAPDSTISGIYANYERLGAAAVEQLTALLEREDFGLSSQARTLLVHGSLCKGSTLKGSKEGTQS